MKQYHSIVESPQGVDVLDEHSHPLRWFNNAMTLTLWAPRVLQPCQLCAE